MRPHGDPAVDVRSQVDLDAVALGERRRVVGGRAVVADDRVDREAGREGDALFDLLSLVDLGGEPFDFVFLVVFVVGGGGDWMRAG